MAFESEQGVIAHHPTAIVSDLDELLATCLDLNADARGLGIERIFKELFHHGYGPLYYLAGGDFVGNGFGKNVNLAHDVGWPVGQSLR